MRSFVPVDIRTPHITETLAAYVAERQSTFPEGPHAYKVAAPNPFDFIPPQGIFFYTTEAETPKVVACGGIRSLPSLSPHSYEIKHLWVAPAHRGQGIGAELLSALETKAIELGAKELVLDTNHALIAANNLYQKFGFTPRTPYNTNPNATRWYQKTV